MNACNPLKARNSCLQKQRSDNRVREQLFIGHAMSNRYDLAKALLDTDKDLVDARDDLKRTALHWSASNGSLEMTQLLLKNNSDLNATVGYFDWGYYVADAGIIALQLGLLVASGGGCPSMSLPLGAGLGKNVREANYINLHKATPLALAAANGYKEIADLLIKHGANVN